MDQNSPSIKNLLDELEDMLEKATSMPFSRNVIVNIDEVTEIISEMRANLPNQIKQAEKIISNCNKTVGEANNQAKTIIEQAKTQAKELTSEHEITQLAQEEYANMVEAASEESKRLRLGAREYIKDRMMATEEHLNELLEAFSNTSIQMQSFISNEIDQCYKIRQSLLDTVDDDAEEDDYPAEDDYDDYDDYDEE